MRPLVRYLLTVLLCIAAAGTAAQSQSLSSATVPNFPHTFSPSNIGTEFYFSFPANWDYSAPQKYCRLYITAGVVTTVKVYAGPTLVKIVQTVPYDIVQVDITLLQGQIFTRNDMSPVPVDQLYKGQAVHVVSDDPIVIYGMNRITATSDGMILFPNSSLGRQYVVASAQDITGGFQKLPSQYMVIAAYDGTTVTMINSAVTYNQTGLQKAGQTWTITMNKGDVYSVMSATAFGAQTGATAGDLSGSVITATKPIAVTAGQNCTYLPDYRYPACDHIEEEMLPVSAWGKVYHAVNFRNRQKGDMFRIFGSSPDTHVSVNGVPTWTLGSLGGQEGIGWVQLLPQLSEMEEFTADKPIYIAQYNNSQQYDNATQTDPFELVLTPVEQYQTDLVFATPANDYPQSYLNLVCDSAGYYQIEIAKGGTSNFEKVWQKYPAIVRPFPTLVNGKRYVGASIDIGPGSYRMRGTSPFAGYLYGFGNYDSYGYPLSAAVGDLTKNDSIAPYFTHTQDCFGTVKGAVSDLPNEDSIRTNLNSVRLDSGSYNYILSVTQFIPGLAQGTTYTLNVRDQTQDARAIVIATDQAGNVSRDTVYFAAFSVKPNPVVTDFGSMFIGDQVTKVIKLTNNATRPVTITATKLQFGNRGFVILSPTGPFTLDPKGGANSSMDVTVQFTATVSGSFKDSIGVRDSCGFRYLALVKANVGTPVISVSDKDFGAWPITGAPKPGQIFIKNISPDGAPLTVTGVQKDINDKVVFTLPNGLPAFPLTLAPQQEQPLNVSFGPTAVKAYLDSIVFSSNARPNEANDSTGILKGTGITGALVVTDYDWGRKRVGTGPYTGTVVLHNYGSSIVNVTGTNPPTGDLADFRITDNTVYITGILPGDSVVVPVEFNPTAIGPRTWQVEFLTKESQTTQVISHLTGIGTFPALVTSDYNFGSMDVNAPEVQRTIVFNLPPAAPGGDYLDSVTITALNESGDNDFRMDPVTTPIVLKRGIRDSVIFTGYFGAKSAGLRTHQVTAVTQDGVDTTSHWVGQGLVKDVLIDTVGADFGALCGGSRQLPVSVKNTGGLDLIITNLSMSGLNPDFKLISPPTLPDTIKPGGSLSLTVQFTPTGSGVETETVDVTSNATNSPLVNIRVSGLTTGQTLTATAVLTGTTGARAEFAKQIIASVKLLTPADAAFQVTNFQVHLTYDTTQLFAYTDQLAVGKDLPAGSTVAFDPSSKPGNLVINVKSFGPFTTVGELVSIPMGVLFTAKLTRDIAATVTTVDYSCLTFNTTPATIDVTPICGLAVRLIELTGTTYLLKQNSPNPATQTTKIEYSLGLDGQTKITLHDSRGKLVQNLFEGYQQPGRYEMTLDATNLPSGLYYYTLESGDWKQTRSLTVTK